MPTYRRSSTPAAPEHFTTADAYDRRSRSSGSNGDRADRLSARGGGGVAGDSSLDPWGYAATYAAALAPYQIEVAEGQVALPGQRDGVVAWMQASLQRLGFTVGAAGAFDNATLTALREWQRLNGLEVSGQFGPDELEAMERAVDASFNLQQFQANAPGIPEDTLREYLPHLNAAMFRADITTDARKAVFIAQLGHESDGFNTLEEYASGADYEGRTDLGNLHPGDGRRFKGRGPIQITGRDNYTSYGRAIGVDLVSNPELAATPEIGFRLAAEYWNRTGLNQYADRGQFDTVTQRINGGQNGAADRRSRWRRAQRVQQDWAATPDVVLRPTPRPDDLGEMGPAPLGAVDSTLELLGQNKVTEAITDAERIAAASVEDEAALAAASLVRDVARHLLDAQEAFDTDRFREAKDAAHQAAQGARALRDNGVARNSLTDPVIARAGSWWRRANAAAETQGRGADIALMEAALPLRRGDRGEAVAALQRLLGMDVGGGAGVFGRATERAVREYQRENGLGVDGVVGSGTADSFRR